MLFPPLQLNALVMSTPAGAQKEVSQAVIPKTMKMLSTTDYVRLRTLGQGGSVVRRGKSRFATASVCTCVRQAFSAPSVSM